MKYQDNNNISYLNNLYNTINPENSLCDFEKIKVNVKNLEMCCNELNKILNITNKQEFLINLINSYPKEMLKIILLCLGLRDKKKTLYFYDKESRNETIYDFSKTIDAPKIWELCEKSGFIDFIETTNIKDFFSYIIGVEIGLDTNARKNRYGKEMANLMENILLNDPGIENVCTEVNTVKPWMENYLNDDEKKYLENKKKRFDFAFEFKNKVYFTEVNFYTSSGSKLNEVAKSYQKINNEFEQYDNMEFIWITDGIGWENAKKDLLAAKTNNKYLLFLNELEQEDNKLSRILDKKND